MDGHRAYYAGLCLEEIAGNVVLHGFAKDKKRHSVDIRVSLNGDDVIMRLHDNCVPFNPALRAESGDRIRNVGIRLVYGIAKDFQYQRLLGLNSVVIRI